MMPRFDSRNVQFPTDPKEIVVDQMSDYGLELVDLTGRWVGFYRQRWEQLGTFPIVADLVQTGRKITGEMFDQITAKSNYLDDLLEVYREDLSDRVRQNWVNAIRQFGTEVVRNFRLPETSDTRGSIKGSRVQFVKSYRGAMELTFNVGEKQLGSLRRERHRVHYSGQLDRERMCITGKWTIAHRGLLGWVLPPQARGTFELYSKR
jgi:hypothetical protein